MSHLEVGRSMILTYYLGDKVHPKGWEESILRALHTPSPVRHCANSRVYITAHTWTCASWRTPRPAELARLENVLAPYFCVCIV